MKKVKEIAKLLLKTEIQEGEIPGMVYHPFTKLWQHGIYDLRKPDDLKAWYEEMERIIDNCNLWTLLMYMNEAYLIDFLKLCEPYIDNKLLGDMLGKIWILTEDANMCRSATNKDYIRWFTNADKKTLMSDLEREKLSSLPSEVKIYRGVTAYNKHNKKAISWTLNRNIAERFANRFDTGTGEVWEKTISKEKILCYFHNRMEYEVIINPF